MCALSPSLNTPRSCSIPKTVFHEWNTHTLSSHYLLVRSFSIKPLPACTYNLFLQLSLWRIQYVGLSKMMLLSYVSSSQSAPTPEKQPSKSLKVPKHEQATQNGISKHKQPTPSAFAIVIFWTDNQHKTWFFQNGFSDHAPRICRCKILLMTIGHNNPTAKLKRSRAECKRETSI